MRWIFGLLLPCLALIASRQAPAAEITPAENGVVQGDRQFALDLYARLDREQPGKNLFFSPASISLALAMTAAGARGPTQAEMARVLHLDADLAAAQAHDRQLLERCGTVGRKPGCELCLASRLWGQQGSPIRPEFLALTRQQYGAEMLLVDFAQAEAAGRTINQWVQQQTNGRIQNLVPPGSLGILTRLVLTSAVCFKGDWVQPFDRRNTREEDFTISAQKKVKLPLMFRKATLGYAEEQTFQALELPYAGRELSMVVLLPKKADGLPELEKAVTAPKLAALLSTLRAREVAAYLPRFKMETSFALKPTLEALGMKRAFSRDADFSGISTLAELYVSAVLHKAYVVVNEEGTEAAAATGVVMKTRAIRPHPPVPVFRADHPFLFLIRDAKTGSILFLGRLTSPAGAPHPAATPAPAGSSPESSGTHQDWQFIQQAGGLRVGAPQKLAAGKYRLPVKCDVSGLQAVSVRPTALNSGIAIEKIGYAVQGGTLQLWIVTCAAGGQRSAAVESLVLEGMKPGKYKVQYRDKDLRVVDLREIEIVADGVQPEKPGR